MCLYKMYNAFFLSHHHGTVELKVFQLLDGDSEPDLIREKIQEKKKV